MSILAAYSLQTGNTEKVAKVIHEALGEKAELKPPDVNCEATIQLYWATGDKGTANAEALEFMKALSGKQVVLFGKFLGAGDRGYHFSGCAKLSKELPADCTLLGHQLYRASSMRLKPR